MGKWIIGIGGMKCASTWIYQCLKEHPDICMSSIKELKYFTGNYDKGIDWYLSNFKSCSPDKIKGEFSPSYLYFATSAERIHNFCSNAKIIVSIRNPIGRLISHYKHSIRSNSISEDLSISDAIKTKGGLLEWGLYYKYLVPFYNFFEKENIVLVSEEINENPQNVLKYLYSRVGVSSHYEPSVTAKFVSKGIIPRIAWLERFKTKFYYYLAGHGQGALINLIVRSRIPELYRRLNKKPEKKVFLTDELRSELVSYYREDVQKLRILTGLSLKQWAEFNE